VTTPGAGQPARAHKNCRIADVGGLRKMLEIIRYVHHGNFPSVGEITRDCQISKAQFYRHRVTCLDILRVLIAYNDGPPRRGYYINFYGILNKEKL
jgi:hypothetical protein